MSVMFSRLSRLTDLEEFQYRDKFDFGEGRKLLFVTIIDRHAGAAAGISFYLYST